MAQNAVIVYMSRTQDAPLLFRSIVLLYQNFKYAASYPVVVFHDDITAMTIANLRIQWHQALGYIPNIRFEELKFSFPAGFKFDPAKVDPETPLTEFWMGYRHMCRFHSGEIYKDPRLLQYDYYWRLDSDSYLISRIDFDPFEHMAQNDLEYAYMCDEDGEVPRVAKGLGETTIDYAKRVGSLDKLSPRLKDGKWNYELFYTNFEIAKFSFFRSPQYQSYYDHLDATGNFYYQRWGDAPVHWLGVRMFLPDSKVWAVKNIAYQHNNWVKNLNAVNEPEFENTLKWVDGNATQGRQGRIRYAWNRYKNGGPDGTNWGD
jgi:hypothetical protein